LKDSGAEAGFFRAGMEKESFAALFFSFNFISSKARLAGDKPSSRSINTPFIFFYFL
jgi:hypothetical protein